MKHGKDSPQFSRIDHAFQEMAKAIVGDFRNITAALEPEVSMRERNSGINSPSSQCKKYGDIGRAIEAALDFLDTAEKATGLDLSQSKSELKANANEIKGSSEALGC